MAAHGLTRLASWAGTDRLPGLGARVPALARARVTRASAMLALFVAGVEVARSLVGADLEPFIDLVELRGDVARATVAILPIGRRVIICDRADASAERELVCWPDDSSFHLLHSIPAAPRRATWLDLGCGSAVAAIASPGTAARIVASDLNPRALQYAARAARFAGLSHVETLEGDLATVPADLITCNAPIPGEHGPLWMATAAGFVARAFASAAAALLPGGMVIVHAALAPLLELQLAGELVIVAYTPVGEPREFAVAWWRPDAAPRQVRARRALAVTRPHLDASDREAALAGTLVPL
jgi:hypothetical protein